MNEESTVLPDAREGSPTAPRGAPEAWWAGAAPRPFGGSQSGGGLRPREEARGDFADDVDGLRLKRLEMGELIVSERHRSRRVAG